MTTLPPSDRDHESEMDIYRAGSVAEIKATLAHLDRQEATVTAQLNSLIASQQDLSRELGRLDLLRAHLGSQVVNARAIGNGMLSDAAATAKRISSAVKRLDVEQANVKATLEMVEQVAELKACVLGVHGSMGAPQDWETAAGYLSRASKIPTEVVDGSFAEEIVPTAEVPDPPRVTLDSAAESLCGLFLREFEKAAKEGDGTRVTRFFKLFPLIGRSDIGLDAYGRYVCHGVASRARTTLNSVAVQQRKEGLFYASALTKLFEHIAQIVDRHEPLVEMHYGPGMMVKVLQRLQIEADVQGGILIDTWHDERVIDRKLTDIKSYAFTFHTQGLLPTSGRSSSPAKRDGSPAGRQSEDDGVDMKEVDAILGEAAIMLGRWALLSRFIASKCLIPDPDKENDDHGRAPLVMPAFLANSNLSKKVSKLLIEPFNVMTTFFFRRSVEKAFQLDEPPADLTLNPNKPLGANPPFITSAIDDVMYIVNQVIQRTLATSERAVIATVIPAIGRILGNDFVNVIKRKMRDESYPKAAIQGALPPEDKVIAFLVLMNNLDIASDYLDRIVKTYITSTSAEDGSEDTPKSNKNRLADLFPFNNDADFVTKTLKTMELTYESKASELLGDGITVTFNQIMKPRIRFILTETFRDIEYNPASNDVAADGGDPGSPDIDLGDDDSNDIVKSRFDRSWNAFTRPMKRILTQRNYDRLLVQTLPYLAERLESRIWSYYGRVNELGAVRLERDIAGIVNAAVAGARYSLRDEFAKCTQMTLIMNMEEDEWEEARNLEIGEEGEMGIKWALDREQRQRARAPRTAVAKESKWRQAVIEPKCGTTVGVTRPRICAPLVESDIISRVAGMGSHHALNAIAVCLIEHFRLVTIGRSRKSKFSRLQESDWLTDDVLEPRTRGKGKNKGNSKGKSKDKHRGKGGRRSRNMGQESSTEMVDETTPPRTLESRTVAAIANMMKEGRAKKIVVMTGAGISTSAGIPDFRSPNTGLYANLARLNLPYAEAVFDISYFRNNPVPFYTLAEELFPGKFRPTITHSFIRMLWQKGYLLKLFTQNIDCLEREAGLPGDVIIEAHGSFAENSCIECKETFSADQMRTAITSKIVPRCLSCSGLVKPNIVFFGEQLPSSFFDNRTLPESADLCIVMGTSLSVQPFAMLPDFCSEGTPRLLINMDRVGSLGSRPDDVLLLGECDDGVRKLAEACGWLEELEAIWAETAPKSAAGIASGKKAQEKTKDELVEEEVEKITREVEESLKFLENSRAWLDSHEKKLKGNNHWLDEHMKQKKDVFENETEFSEGNTQFKREGDTIHNKPERYESPGPEGSLQPIPGSSEPESGGGLYHVFPFLKNKASL